MLKVFKAMLLLLLLAATLAGGGLFRFWIFLHQPGSARIESKVVTIQPGMHFREIARLLYSQGLISEPVLFRVLGRFRKSDHNLKAGEYRLTTMMTPDQVLTKLRTGQVVVYQVTFPEGSTLQDVARALEEAKLVSEQKALALMRNQDFVHSLGLDGTTLEGYLFPDTYHFVRSQKPEAILRAMVRQFHLQVDPLWRRRTQPENSDMHLQDVVILASLVEKEAAVASERPTIAAVFLNRLKLGMKLQSDPTTVYDLEGFSGPIKPIHLKRKSPYNTYIHKGLPAGPICNPGASSIAAVLHAADVPYLFFVSNLDGTHTFSKTYSEHLKAVNEYRRKLTRGE